MAKKAKGGFQPRSVWVLAELPRAEMLAELAQGMRLIAEHVASLFDGAVALHDSGSHVAVQTLEAISNEEAGKYLILLDAARCARAPEQHRRDQLSRFSQHLAKGIYAETAYYRPCDLAELEERIRRLRRDAYLDGPHGTDWIFRNEVEGHREERLYVDFVRTDAGATYWHSPAVYADSGFAPMSAAVRLVGALHRMGASTVEGLTVVDEIWHDFVPISSTSWPELQPRVRRTLETWVDASLATEATEEDVRLIRESWTFPLHSVPMERIKVALGDLRAEQEAVE